jgi:hypothetical protein
MFLLDVPDYLLLGFIMPTYPHMFSNSLPFSQCYCFSYKSIHSETNMLMCLSLCFYRAHLFLFLMHVAKILPLHTIMLVNAFVFSKSFSLTQYD